MKKKILMMLKKLEDEFAAASVAQEGEAKLALEILHHYDNYDNKKIAQEQRKEVLHNLK